MIMTKRSLVRLAVPVVFLYAVTWLVAAMTLQSQLGPAWMAYAARSVKDASPTQSRVNTPDEAAGHDIDVNVNTIVPVLPAVVLINSDLTGTFNPGGVNRFTVGSWSLVAVYGV